MILPTTFMSALWLLIASAVCLGSWANLQKLAGKWRFELFYYDFIWGVVIAALVGAFTFGSFDPKDLTFQDNFLLAGYRKMAWALAAGVVFNLANVLLAAAVAVAGMSVAFPVSLGLGLIVAEVWTYSFSSPISPVLLFSGAGVVLAAVCAAGLAHSFRLDEKQAAEQQALTADPRTKNAPKKARAAKGVILSVLSGLFMGVFYPMVQEARSGEIGVAPYGLMLLFAAGMFLSTVGYVPFFLTFPVLGKPLVATAYFRGTARQHVMGILGGVVWMVGGLANAVVAGAPAATQITPALSYLSAQAAAPVAVFWGLAAWHEFSGTSLRVKMVLTAMVVLFLAGLGLIGLALFQAR